MGRFGDVVGVRGFHGLGCGDLDHDGRVDHLGRWAITHWRSVAGVRKVCRDGVGAGDRHIRDGGGLVVGTLAWNLIVTVCTGRLGVAGSGPGADNFIRGGGECHGRGGI